MKTLMLIYLFSLFISQFAGAQGITYHGRLLNASGAVVTASVVQFLIEIRTPGNEDCLMYSETQTKNLSTTGGAFAITLNDGTGTRNDSSGLNFANVFANKGTVTFPGGTCAVGTTRAFAITDGRRVRAYFNDGTFAGWEAFPDEAMNFAPMAVESAQVSGYKASNLLRSDVGTTVPEFTSTDITELISLVSGASNLYSKQSTAGGSALPSYAGNPATPAAGSMWYDSTSGSVKFYNGSTSQSLGSAGSIAAGSAGTPSLAFSTDTDTGLYSSGANSLGFTAGGAQIFNMSTSTFASPTTGGALITSTNGTAAAPAFSFTGDSDTGWYRAAADTLAASTAGTERMRIDASGNVGIGTTAPGSSLHIARSTGGGVTVQTANSTSWEYPHVDAQRSRGTLAAKTIVSSGDNLFGIDSYGYDGGNFIQAAGIDFQVDGTPGSSDMPGRILLYTTADGASTPTGMFQVICSFWIEEFAQAA